MPHITFTYPDGRVERVALEGDTFTIGREDDNTIVLADQRVSSHHAVIKRGPDGQFIVNDLGATNPTRVNGSPTQIHALRDGDTLIFGDIFAAYEEGPKPQVVDPRQLRRPGPLAPASAEPAGQGCFALLAAGTFGAALAWFR